VLLFDACKLKQPPQPIDRSWQDMQARQLSAEAQEQIVESYCMFGCFPLPQAEEGVEETQTQGGPDLLFSSNITRQQLLEKEEQFKVREPIAPLLPPS
jgi:hypothetical protein